MRDGVRSGGGFTSQGAPPKVAALTHRLGPYHSTLALVVTLRATYEKSSGSGFSGYVYSLRWRAAGAAGGGGRWRRAGWARRRTPSGAGSHCGPTSEGSCQHRWRRGVHGGPDTIG